MDLTFEMVKKNAIFKDRHVLTELKPPGGKFVHRENQKKELILELAPLLSSQRASNLFVYGVPGTGKTALMSYLADELKTHATRDGVPMQTVYVNCSAAKTDTLILLAVLRQLSPKHKIPKAGVNRSTVIRQFLKHLKDEALNLLIVLDEIDMALKSSGDDILYFLSRVKDDPRVRTNVCTVIISNDVKVPSYLQPKTQSSFGRAKIVFPRYDAAELTAILRDRAKHAFCDGVLAEGVIQKIAALEARSGGDAREACELLYACGKTVIATGQNQVTLGVVDSAHKHLESDTLLNVICLLTLHQKLLLRALLECPKSTSTCNAAFSDYLSLCHHAKTPPLSRRRIQSFLVQFDDANLIASQMGYDKSLGKKTRCIMIPYPKEVVAKVLARLR